MTLKEKNAAWRAVLTRDPAADGRFVYAVSSTGIFCRPTCPAKRPRRDRVEFYSTPAEAARSGFRACRRCNPVSAMAPGAAAVAKARAVIDRHVESAGESRLLLADIAAEVGYSASHLQRAFRKFAGVSPRQYEAIRRAEAFKEKLRSEATVIRATFASGYGSSSRAYAAADRNFGMPPAKYREGGAGETIEAGGGDTALGYVLAASTKRGLCSVVIAESAEEAERELRAEFPKARIVAVGRDSKIVRMVLDLATGRPATAPSARLSGTAFQLRVWEELRKIPRGETRTYGEIARQIGQPGAARAVGSACARNRVALVVPCHRVVRRDGEIGDYRWGSERKRRLLEIEKSEATQAP